MSRPFHKDEGLFENGKLILSKQSNKVDWLYVVDPQKMSPIPVLGDFLDELERIRPLISKWLKDKCPPTNRFAFGSDLLQPVDSQIRGNQRISEYLRSVNIDLEHSSDFAYQINRPCASGVIKGMQINRLSKWSVIRIQTIFQVINSGQGVVAPNPLSSEVINACRLEVDINTSADFHYDIPKDSFIPILDELINLGTSITEHGDEP